VFTAEGWQAPAYPLLAMCFFMIFLYFFGPLFHWIITKVFPSYVVGEIEVDQNVENYWKSLDKRDRKWSQMEEENSRNLFKKGLKIMTDESY
jgi:hypothetical protein